MVASPAVPTPHAGRWRASIEPIVRHAGWFGFFLVLAPIIGPRGYGTFAIALSGIAIVEALLVEAIAATLARLEPPDDRHLSTALVSAVGIGAAISLLLYMSAGQFGLMLDEVPLGDMVRSLSLLPVLGGLAAVPTALLRRRGKAGPLVAATIAGLAAGGGVSVALAWSGAGAWSLVAQIVVQRFVECAVTWGMVARRLGLVWSPPHFGQLLDGLDLAALARVWPVISRQAPLLVIGLVLGPVASGLYLLAARFAEALEDILLAAPKPVRSALLADWARHIGEPFRRVALPAILFSLLLPVALPPIVDIRWWGAVLPAQLLLLGLVPTAAIAARAAAVGAGNESRWQAMGAIGGIAAVALAVPYGLVAVAAASLAYASCVALAGLCPIRREFGSHWWRTLPGTARPLIAATASGLILHPFVEPVALALAPGPALGLLGVIGLLCYLLLSGEPHGLRLPAFAFRRGLRPVKPA
jgi:polysaccharide transporter, PST family